MKIIGDGSGDPQSRNPLDKEAVPALVLGLKQLVTKLITDNARVRW